MYPRGGRPCLFFVQKTYPINLNRCGWRDCATCPALNPFVKWVNFFAPATRIHLSIRVRASAEPPFGPSKKDLGLAFYFEHLCVSRGTMNGSIESMRN